VDPAWLLVVPAYLLGTFPTAILVGRREGRDPTREGSGNPGASNTFRTMGRRAGTLVLAGDVAKGALAAGIGLATGNRAVGVACGLAAVVGHIFPVTRRLRGGKGVATGAGMAIVLLPGVTLVLGLVWLVTVKVFRAASAGSVVVAVGFPVGAWLVGRPPGEVLAFAATAALIVLRHRENLDRLRRGDEPSLAQRPNE
jgi:acyl phosphate:glycerol-3-phosphate acyltransferase